MQRQFIYQTIQVHIYLEYLMDTQVFFFQAGFQVSKFIQKTFVTTFLNQKEFKQNHIKQALTNTFLEIQQNLKSQQFKPQIKKIKEQKLGQKINQTVEGGSTANVVIITKDKIYCANAGDSRSVLFRNQQVIPLSNDHKPQNLEEMERITKAGGIIIEGRVDGGLNLSRAIGDFNYKRNQNISLSQQKIIPNPEIRQIQRSKYDQFIIMGCDGIWQKFVDNNLEMAEIINSKRLKRYNRISKKQKQQVIVNEGGDDKRNLWRIIGKVYNRNQWL